MAGDFNGGGYDDIAEMWIEAYPDVADTWVQLIMQWPGHAAEEVERQITLPSERVMNSVPRQTTIRATTSAGRLATRCRTRSCAALLKDFGGPCLLEELTPRWLADEGPSQQSVD